MYVQKRDHHLAGSFSSLWRRIARRSFPNSERPHRCGLSLLFKSMSVIARFARSGGELGGLPLRKRRTPQQAYIMSKIRKHHPNWPPHRWVAKGQRQTPIRGTTPPILVDRFSLVGGPAHNVIADLRTYLQLTYLAYLDSDTFVPLLSHSGAAFQPTAVRSNYLQVPVQGCHARGSSCKSQASPEIEELFLAKQCDKSLHTEPHSSFANALLTGEGCPLVGPQSTTYTQLGSGSHKMKLTASCARMVFLPVTTGEVLDESNARTTDRPSYLLDFPACIRWSTFSSANLAVSSDGLCPL